MQKIALVTGANRGIGLGLSQGLAKRGYLVYQGVRNLSSASQTKGLRPIEFDVTNDASILQAAERIKAEYGHLDVLINNAGLGRKSATNGHDELVSNLESIDRSKVQDMFNVNATSALMVVRACAPLMTNPSCRIINISSDRGSFGEEGTSGASNANYAYRASKAALNMITQCLVHDLPENVEVVAVHPGHVITDMNPGGKITPAEAADNILGLLDRWQPGFNGSFIHTDGTFYDK